MSRSRFAGQCVLVTGAGTGLGRAIALAFAAEGARVVVAGRTRATLDGTVDLIEAAGGTAVAHTADVSRAGDLQELVRASVERFGSLDVAVNNAGVFRGAGPVAELAADDWQTLLDINVTGVLLALQAEVAQMRTQGRGGAIVNISSNLGPHKSLAGVTGYAVSKAAVSALTRGAALDHIGDGVRVNAVSPGPSATAMSLRPGETEAERAVRMKEQSPLGRVAAADEVAAAVLYLASEDAAAVVGADLVIDGGAAA
ncbi:SDR family oxidoreductase [Streptomyces sp. AcE210]|uniref:SDR family NAD(P)-dependent oxidoreductase n=1 Tax=Streptomyces sp. AcE210 TaxID=2292703 RepID=UPI000E3052F1|nr:SDR family oxidoreductase [Streptomyces sp. AcE210]RFC75238.1 SDR family oxidoreductase [Streptomyces sp. AcE210]